MQALNAVVKNGRLTLDEPSELPEGQVVPLLPLDELLTLANAFDDRGGVSFEVVPAPRQWAQPRPLDAAALLDEIRAI